jgi:hypothetical protein
MDTTNQFTANQISSGSFTAAAIALEAVTSVRVHTRHEIALAQALRHLLLITERRLGDRDTPDGPSVIKSGSVFDEAHRALADAGLT